MVNIGKKQFIFGIFILVLGLGLFGCNKQPVTNENIDVNNNATWNTNENSNIAVITTYDVDTSGWTIYRNEGYGFEFNYPPYYSTDKIYSIWQTKEGANNLKLQWGVNKYQETVFAISIFGLEDGGKVRSRYNFTGEKIKLNNGFIAEKDDYTHMMIEYNGYIYVISSSFINISKESEEYKEFVNVLNTLELQHIEK